MLLGYMKPVSASYTLDLNVRFGALPTGTTRYTEVTFSHPDDTAFDNVTGAKGYAVLLRANGTMALFYRDDTTAAATGPNKSSEP